MPYAGSKLKEFANTAQGSEERRVHYSEKTVTEEGWQHTKVELKPL